MTRFPCRGTGRCRVSLDALEPRRLLSSDPLTETFEAPNVGQPARVSAESSLLTLQQIHVTTGVEAAHIDYGLTGLGQTVVVIDSGIAYDHLALGGGLGPGYRVVGGWDFTEENDDDPYDDGPAGFHGTHVAGIIGSSDPTHRGVAPAVDLVALRVFNDRGRGKLDWLETSLQWVVEHVAAFDHPITTVNLSLGTNWNEATLPEYANLEDELRQLHEAGVFVAVAAGNRFDATHEGLSYPAVSPYVTPAASLDTLGQLSDFSQRYATVIAAPGEKITSTVPDYLEDFNGVTDDFYAASGTSMAAPYVAASSVLVREAMQRSGVSEITVDAIRDVLAETAEFVFDPVTGQSYRRLNVLAAIEQVLGPPAANVIDLGVIDSAVSYSTQPTTGLTELRFTSRFSGLLLVEVTRSTNRSSGQSQGRLAQTETNRLILSVLENQPVRTELPMGIAISALRVSPLVSPRGNLLVADGTTGNHRPGHYQFFAKPTQSWMQNGPYLTDGFDAVFASGGRRAITALRSDSGGIDALCLDGDHMAREGAEIHYDLASFARMVARATIGRDRSAVDSVLSQAMQDRDAVWTPYWGTLSWVAEGFESAS